MSSERPLIGLFGGTFDPIHNGHLFSAKELSSLLGADELRFIPCHRPPHRVEPGANSAQRLAMVELAIAPYSGLSVDNRELNRDKLSYSIDTLTEIRHECGEQAVLCWIMGMDAFLNLPTWHRWQDLLNISHIVVMARTGYVLPKHGLIAEVLAERQLHNIEQLKQKAAGCVLIQNLTPYPISATAIRLAIRQQQAVDDYLPKNVLNYIEQQQLYRSE